MGLAPSELKFRVNVKNGVSNGAFKYMVHVDARCNISCFCTRQKQGRASPPHNNLHAKENTNLRMPLFSSFFTKSHQTDHVLYRAIAHCYIIVFLSGTVNNGHTLVTQARSLKKFFF